MYCAGFDSQWAQFVNKKGSDDVFSWDFRRNKAVKFNSGQYMNFSGRLFHGSGRYQEIYGIF